VYGASGSGIKSDGFIDIKVKYQDGTTFTKLLDNNNLERTLIALNVTREPYTWGMNNAGAGPAGIDYVWNTTRLRIARQSVVVEKVTILGRYQLPG
jgi:hypothetical protein